MAFFRIASNSQRANAPGICKASISQIAGGKPGHSRLGLRLVLGSDLLDALGCKAGDRVDLLWGRDVDVARVLLVKGDEVSGISIKRGAHCKHTGGYVSFAALPTDPIMGTQGSRWTLEHKSRPVAVVNWRKTDDGVVVDLPTGWWDKQHSEARLTTQALTRPPMPVARIA